LQNLPNGLLGRQFPLSPPLHNFIQAVCSHDLPPGNPNQTQGKPGKSGRMQFISTKREVPQRGSSIHSQIPLNNNDILHGIVILVK
jgi:hypothetical protein